MTAIPSLLVVLQSIGFDVPEGASHLIIDNYTTPTRVAFIMAGPAPAVTRDLTEFEKAKMIRALDLHRRSRLVALRIDPRVEP